MKEMEKNTPPHRGERKREKDEEKNY